MDIDLAALRSLERERDISLAVLIPAIEQALLVAYHRTDGSQRLARVELDRLVHHAARYARDFVVPGLKRRAPDAREAAALRDLDTPAACGARPRARRPPRWVRSHRGIHRSSGHRAAPARHRGRSGARRLQGPRGRCHLRDHPAESGPPQRARRLRQCRGHPAAGRADPRRTLRSRRAVSTPRGRASGRWALGCAPS